MQRSTRITPLTDYDLGFTEIRWLQATNGTFGAFFRLSLSDFQSQTWCIDYRVRSLPGQSLITFSFKWYGTAHSESMTAISRGQTAYVKRISLTSSATENRHTEVLEALLKRSSTYRDQVEGLYESPCDRQFLRYALSVSCPQSTWHFLNM